MDGLGIIGYLLIGAMRAERHGAVRPAAIAMFGIETGIVLSTTTYTAYAWHWILQPFEQVIGIIGIPLVEQVHQFRLHLFVKVEDKHPLSKACHGAGLGVG